VCVCVCVCVLVLFLKAFELSQIYYYIYIYILLLSVSVNNLANQVFIAKNWKTVNTGVEHDMLSSSDSIFGLCVCVKLCNLFMNFR